MSDWTASHLIELGIVAGLLLAAIVLVAAAGVVRARREAPKAQGWGISNNPRCDRTLAPGGCTDCALDQRTAVQLVEQLRVCSDVLCLQRTRRVLMTCYGGDTMGQRLARLIDVRLEVLR